MLLFIPKFAWLMTTTTDFAKFLSRFLTEYLPHERNMSNNTLSSYRDTFVQFIDFMKNEKKIPVNLLSLKHLTRENILHFMKWILDERGCTPATRNYRLAAIHSFISFLQYVVIENGEEWQKILSIKVMRSESKPMSFLSTDGIRLLLAQPDITTRQGRRHLAILSLMYDTGARVQEIADLTVESVRIEYEPYSIRLRGKGGKSRIVPMVMEQTNILRQYMDENNLNNSNMYANPLFYNNRHEKLTREGIAYILKTYAGLARKKSVELIPHNLSCHSIRHSKAMHLLQAGVNLVYIRDILGHVSIQTTDIYARADSKAKQEALERAYRNLNPTIPSIREWERNKNLREWLKSLN